MLTYEKDFYKNLLGEEEKTKYVAKKVYDYLSHYLELNSAVDLGCGVGTWLSMFCENDDKIILGVDGNWVEESQLLISKENFVRQDLNERVQLSRKFDLAQSMEVAEHLPENRAESFVEDLTNLADIVLFSAAIPYQGGVNHINEQWPSYWIDLFDRYDYQVFDLIRPVLWNDPNVSQLHYKQNLFLFVKRGTKEFQVIEKINGNKINMYDIVHPDIYLYHSKERDLYKSAKRYKIVDKLMNIYTRIVNKREK